mmetsp:Transcript_40841/g.96991  ORF Transcript_40841/g.96991 Transcript_40841/m.96991 type:complete len:288 (+) Transcript_40841:1227-2090(+)
MATVLRKLECAAFRSDNAHRLRTRRVKGQMTTALPFQRPRQYNLPPPSNHAALLHLETPLELPPRPMEVQPPLCHLVAADDDGVRASALTLVRLHLHTHARRSEPDAKPLICRPYQRDPHGCWTLNRRKRHGHVGFCLRKRDLNRRLWLRSRRAQHVSSVGGRGRGGSSRCRVPERCNRSLLVNRDAAPLVLRCVGHGALRVALGAGHDLPRAAEALGCAGDVAFARAGALQSVCWLPLAWEPVRARALDEPAVAGAGRDARALWEGPRHELCASHVAVPRVDLHRR